jgi:hypothetical protein
MLSDKCPECGRELVPVQAQISVGPNGFPYIAYFFQPHNTRPDIMGGETCKGSNTEVSK